ncbi:transmembrane amino acid transporter protein domain-containing protein [Ditylenchus destructor]|uniref:Transmembrane amino acid transporter protein domain-containing protein n=1 Tax=Ditylenchus destructor TaxID=166010 RepID=A0AAD4N8T5_9BILA|nr:transmembrane amino acid transporter protein domain-containing protein [Ditylenchus destructor]
MGITIDSSSIFPSGFEHKSAWRESSESETSQKSVTTPGNTENGLGDYYDENGRLRKSTGLGWILAAFFVVADMAGGGIVALPTAIVRCGFWLGICILAVMCVMATTSAVMLGRAWEILLRRFPEYRTHCRKPYAEIGYRALGPKMKTIVSICVNFTQFGASVVFLLLCAKNIDEFLRAFFAIDIGFCIVILVVALLLLPITMLKSPQDFWPVVVGGMVSTGLAVVLVGVGSMMDYADCGPVSEMPPMKASNVLVALGTILFTYGGHSAFPTIQHDMKRPSQFDKSSILAFTIITVLNISAVCIGGWTYGDSLRESVINSIQTFWIQQAINVMITAHCLLTVTLLINPLYQEAEELFKIPQGFSMKRVLVRSCIMVAVVFMGLSLPSFGHVLDFIGSSTVTLTSVVFPCLFYLYLAAAEKKANDPMNLKYAMDEEKPISFIEMVRRTDLKTLFYCGVISVIGSVAGLVATYSALKALSVTHFVPPCYLKSFFNTTTNFAPTAVTNCCGPFQNISRNGPINDFCTAIDLEFY